MWWDGIVDSINTGSGRAALALSAGVLALIVFWYGRRDRGESREEGFEELRQKVVDAMSKNNASLDGLSVEAEILIDDLERVLLIVPEHIDKAPAERALEAAQGFSAACKANTLAPRQGMTVHDFSALQASPEAKQRLRYLLMSETITAGHLTQSTFDKAFDPVRQVVKKLDAKYG